MDFRKLLGFKTIYGPAISVGVRDMERAVAWYCDKLELDHEPKRTDVSEVKIGYPGGEFDLVPLILLVKIPEGHSNVYAGCHPVIFTRRLKEVHEKLASNGIAVGAIEQDSAGNSFFRFVDCEGNQIEICLEPGLQLRSGVNR